MRHLDYTVCGITWRCSSALVGAILAGYAVSLITMALTSTETITAVQGTTATDIPVPESAIPVIPVFSGPPNESNAGLGTTQDPNGSLNDVSVGSGSMSACATATPTEIGAMQGAQNSMFQQISARL